MPTEAEDLVLNGILKTLHYQKRQYGSTQTDTDTHNGYLVNSGRKTGFMIAVYSF